MPYGREAMSYLIFEHKGKSESGKTDRWVVKSKLNPDAILGWIEWHAPWRKYWFCPVNGTAYDASCLHEIGDFLRVEMGKRG
jgi:hypothetical protein